MQETQGPLRILQMQLLQANSVCYKLYIDSSNCLHVTSCVTVCVVFMKGEKGALNLLTNTESENGRKVAQKLVRLLFTDTKSSSSARTLSAKWAS